MHQVEKKKMRCLFSFGFFSTPKKRNRLINPETTREENEKKQTNDGCVCHIALKFLQPFADEYQMKKHNAPAELSLLFWLQNVLMIKNKEEKNENETERRRKKRTGETTRNIYTL